MAGNEQSYGWSSLHDLALLYLACMHGTDDQIDPEETELVMKLLADRAPGFDRVGLEKVLEMAMLMYLGDTGPQMLESSLRSMEQDFSDEQKLEVLQELADIASADGLISPGEVSLIAQLAGRWGLERFLS